MRIRRGGVDRLMRRFLTGTVLILLMLLCGRYISRAAGSITKSDYKDMILSLIHISKRILMLLLDCFVIYCISVTF